MEPESSNSHSQELSSNPYPETNQPKFLETINCFGPFLILSPNLRLGLPKGIFPVGLPVKILKGILASSNPT